MSVTGKNTGEIIRKIKAAVLAGCLLSGVAAASGCGQKETEYMETEDTETKDVIETFEIEENSLAQWQASLEEGKPSELCAEGIRGVSVVREGKPLLAVSYEPRSYKNTFDCWAISEPYQSMAVVDTEAMYAYFHVLTDMELTPAGEVAKEQTGLADCVNTIYAAYYKDQSSEGGQAAPDRGIAYRFGGQNSAGDYYVEAGGKLWLADGEAVEELFTVNPYDCILKVVSVVKVDTVFRVEIAFADQVHEMEAAGETFRIDGESVDSGRYYELYTDLMSVFIEKELPKDAGAGAEQELLMTVTYHRNMEQAPKIIQRYYVYDDTYALVEVNGMAFFLVSREEVERLQKSILKQSENQS